MMDTKEAVLQQCTVKENNIYLPPQQLERKLYQEVARSLELIGGKWKGGKTGAFVFATDPTDLLAEIANGEKRNLKKEYQFFATPVDLADYLVLYAYIKPGHTILEPSAGQGAILKAILAFCEPRANIIHWVEKMPLNRTILNSIYGNAPGVVELNPEGDDFLNLHTSAGLPGYDRIIANPPFAKNQDIYHIRKMYECLRPGGRLVSVASAHWLHCDNQKERDFADWLIDTSAHVVEIAAGTFKGSGTMVGGVVITIDK